LADPGDDGSSLAESSAGGNGKVSVGSKEEKNGLIWIQAF
jgi:hypothetical protein